MATRWYLSKQPHTTINPGTLGTWGSTSPKQILNFETTKGATDTSSTLYSLTTSSINTTMMRQFISPGMAAGVVFNSSVTWTLTVSTVETLSTGDFFLRCYGAIVSEDGLTARGYSFTAVDSSEFPTTQAARQISVSGLSGTYTTVAGDRIVLEVGWSKTSSTSASGKMAFGNASTTTDLSGAGDTGIGQNPWLEISVTAGTGTGGGSPPTAVTQDYSVDGYITGVLDEMA